MSRSLTLDDSTALVVEFLGSGREVRVSRPRGLGDAFSHKYLGAKVFSSLLETSFPGKGGGWSKWVDLMALCGVAVRWSREQVRLMRVLEGRTVDLRVSQCVQEDKTFPALGWFDDHPDPAMRELGWKSGYVIKARIPPRVWDVTYELKDEGLGKVVDTKMALLTRLPLSVNEIPRVNLKWAMGNVDGGGDVCWGSGRKEGFPPGLLPDAIDWEFLSSPFNDDLVQVIDGEEDAEDPESDATFWRWNLLYVQEFLNGRGEVGEVFGVSEVRGWDVD